MEKFIYRFVTPQAIISKAQEKEIDKRRAAGYRGPVSAINLELEAMIKAFLDFFDELGSEGWIYCGQADYPDLPYGGCYVFRKPINIKKGIKRIDPLKETNLIEEDKMIEFENTPETQKMDFDLYNKEEELKASTESNSETVNKILFKRQRIVNGDKKDPDDDSNVIDEILQDNQIENLNEEIPDETIRSQLYTQYEKQNSNKKAIWHGKETEGFKSWLDDERSKGDPLYDLYKRETGNIALKNENETSEYQEWLALKMKENESKQKI